MLGAMGKLPGEERPLVGQRANVLKTQVQSLLGERLQAVKQAAMAERIARESLDVTAPASGVPMGIAIPLSPPLRRSSICSWALATAWPRGLRWSGTTTTSPR